jgi:2-polyprenyl-3-methyl-5-hydroxy-6-metoxy-1,4-benzoquinol methylase
MTDAKDAKDAKPATIDFSRRNALTELMDSDATDFATFRDCLIDLAKVNRLTLAYRPTMRFFADLARAGRLSRDRAVSVVDVGSGFGDMLRKLDRWAAQRGFRLDLTGVDLNPWAARAAAEVTAPDRPIRYVTANLFDFSPSQPIDIVVSSLFTHHLDDASLARFVAWMEANSAIGWFVNDLRRHPLPYHAFGFAARTLRFHHFVQHDGPISIARAFDLHDWRDTLAAAGLPPGAAGIRPHFPFRLCVARVKA